MLNLLTIFQKYPITEKVWGREIQLCNESNYCSKLLVLKPRYQSSLHRHTLKHEEFFLLDGYVIVEWVDDDGQPQSKELNIGDSFKVRARTWHRFKSDTRWGESVLLEISSHHDDSDVERMEESGPIG